MATTGITPAGAGKTFLPSVHPYRQGDHPRRCGENYIHGGDGGRRRGSPPQVRGKLVGDAFGSGITRITPAGAGKTSCICSLRFSLKDHPRRCGENRMAELYERERAGSPPQVRGKPPAALTEQTSPRITPAGAGKTFLYTFCKLRN